MGIKVVGKKAQVTIFVIISIIVVSGVLLFLFTRPDTPNIDDKPFENPESFLDSCMKEQVRHAIDFISSQGGFTQHRISMNFAFEDEDQSYEIEYLCYQSQDYLQCINQEPMLFHHIKNEIQGFIESDVETCWTALNQKLEEEGYIVDANKKGYSVVLKEGRVSVPIEGEIILTKSGETTKEENFNVNVASELYSLIKTAQNIVTREAETCNFDYVRYMLVYPDLSIDRFTLGSGEEIYTITHRKTGERFRFAIRGCVIPAGYT